MAININSTENSIRILETQLDQFHALPEQRDLDLLKNQLFLLGEMGENKQRISALSGRVEQLQVIKDTTLASEIDEKQPKVQQTLFFGSTNQYAERGGVRPGISACAVCSLSMVKNLYNLLSSGQSLETAPGGYEKFINDSVHEGIDKRIGTGVPIEAHVDVLMAIDSFPTLAYQPAQGFEGTLDRASRGRNTLNQAIEKLEADSMGTMIGATILRGGATHTLFVDYRNFDKPVYYLSDSHGKNHGNGPARAFIERFESRDALINRLLEMDPFQDGLLAPGQQDPNTLQILPFTVQEEVAPRNEAPVQNVANRVQNVANRSWQTYGYVFAAAAVVAAIGATWLY